MRFPLIQRFLRFPGATARNGDGDVFGNLPPRTTHRKPGAPIPAVLGPKSPLRPLLATLQNGKRNAFFDALLEMHSWGGLWSASAHAEYLACGEPFFRWLQRETPAPHRSAIIGGAPKTAGKTAAAHTHLMNEILRYLSARLVDAFRYPPLLFALPSEKGMAWALTACLFEAYGPKVFGGLSNESPFFPKAFLDVYALEGDLLPGDLLALHLCIEQIVIQLPKRLHLTSEAWSLRHETRRGGGLRHREFLEAYETLGANRHNLKVSAWWNGLNAFMDASPLTRLIYADVCTSSLWPETRTLETDWYRGLETLIAASAAPEENRKLYRWFQDEILALLANSLLAAALSPPLSHGIYRRLDEQLRPLKHPEKHPQFVRWTRFAEALSRERALRIPNLACIVAKQPMLHLWFLYLFITETVASIEPRMRETAPPGGHPSAFLNSSGLGMERFRALLMGVTRLNGAGVDFNGMATAGDIERILNIPLDDQELAASGVSDAMRAQVIRLFTEEPVYLPFQPGLNKAEPAAQLLGRWSVALLSGMHPAAPPVTHEDNPEEEG